jgi:malate/lactate dehydrogenase
MKDYKKFTIVCKNCLIKFEGLYRRDLEKENWHYFETNSGDITHIRKSAMVAVIENETDSNVEVFSITS